eukprot:749818-Hanusia_phi.AAC.2
MSNQPQSLQPDKLPSSRMFHISFGSPSVDVLPQLSSTRPVGRAWEANFWCPTVSRSDATTPMLPAPHCAF